MSPAPLLRRSTVCALLVSLLAGGCAGSYKYCIRLPMPHDRDGIEAEQCDRGCKLGHNEGDYEYLRCLSTCPGAVVTQNDKCGPDDARPGVVCRVTDMPLSETRTQAAASGPGFNIVGALFAIAGSAIASAVESRERSSSSSSSSTDDSAGSSSSARTTLPGQSSPKKHKPAEPTSPSTRRVANPSKD